MIEFKHKLAQIIQKSGMSVTEFAEAHNMSRGVIYNMIGGRQPSMTFIKELIKSDPSVNLNWLLKEDWPNVRAEEPGMAAEERRFFFTNEWKDYLNLIEMAVRHLQEYTNENP